MDNIRGFVAYAADGRFMGFEKKASLFLGLDWIDKVRPAVLHCADVEIDPLAKDADRFWSDTDPDKDEGG